MKAFGQFVRKVFTSLILVVLMLSLIVIPVMATPMGVQGEPDMEVAEQIFGLVLSFGSLVGVAAVITVVINTLKHFGVVQDGTAQNWSAGLNLGALAILIALRIFRPDISLAFLDETAGRVAEVGLVILGYVMQLGISQSTHDKVRDIPIVGKTFTEFRL